MNTTAKARENGRKLILSIILKAVKTFVVVAIVAGLVGAITYTKVQLAGVYSENTKLNKQLDVLVDENINMKYSLESKTGLTMVDSYAEEKLRLQKLDSNQIKYVSVSSDNKPQKVSSPDSSELDKIKEWFVGVLEYIGLV